MEVPRNNHLSEGPDPKPETEQSKRLKSGLDQVGRMSALRTSLGLESTPLTYVSRALRKMQGKPAITIRDINRRDVCDLMRPFKEVSASWSRSPLFLVNGRVRDVVQRTFEKTTRDLVSLRRPAVIFFGSNAHAGSLLRETLPENRAIPLKTDLDWALAFDYDDNSLESENRSIFVELFDRLLPKEGYLSNIEIHSCREHNPTTARYRMYNITSIEHAKEILSMDTVSPSRILLYFFPSVPADVNISNTSFLLAALHDLSIANPDAHLYIINKLSDAWSYDVSGVKAKHITGGRFIDSESREEGLLRRVEFDSQAASTAAFRAMLDQTKETMGDNHV